jgi:hypothetical protein
MYKRKRPKLTEQEKFKALYNVIDDIAVCDDIDTREVFENAVIHSYGDLNYTDNEYRNKEVCAIMVNNIRHTCTNYENTLKNVYKIGIRCGYQRYKNAVLENISSYYPYLSEECDRQKYKINMVNRADGKRW